ncbi:SPOR domain-containing protein [Larkinella soli]|uniref:SPOR domain-containing protein n=1 Tax=Larkinella soli TaxID=1770527 RepID=UPI001E43FBEB|nr:SPOR domain-containing protein [Larkinella soli]
MELQRYIRQSAGLIMLAGLVGLSVGLESCASAKKTAGSRSATVDYNSFDDDLSVNRPKFNVSTAPASRPVGTATPARPTTPTDTRRTLPAVEPLHINRRLDAVLDTIALRNRSIRYAQGYRIQIYVGNERAEVDQAKRLTYQNFPELNPYITYRQPTYRLKVGDFMRRMDAERYLAQLRQQFSSAILLPDRVDIRKSLAIK